MPLTISQVRTDLLSKLGIEDPLDAEPLQDQDCLIAINGALQMLQVAGEDFFTREHVVLPFSAGTALFALDTDVQTVIGPARWNDVTPLRALESRGELDQFDRIFLGNANEGTSEGDPLAYWVENIRQGNAGDIVQVNIWLAPRPLIAGDLYVDVVHDAPTYDQADFSAGTAVLPVAQNYVESVFLPIARMLVTRSSQFSRPDILPGLTTDYERAMATLSYVGGFPNAQHPDKPPRKVEA